MPQRAFFNICSRTPTLTFPLLTFQPKALLVIIENASATQYQQGMLNHCIPGLDPETFLRVSFRWKAPGPIPRVLG